MELDANKAEMPQNRPRSSGLKRLAGRGVSLVVAVLVAGVTLCAVFGLMAIYGFLPLSGFENRISRSIEERLGEGWKVQASSALLQRADGRSAVRIRDVRIQHTNGMSVRAPQAVLSYAPRALLRGQIRLTGIDLLGVNLRLGVDADGALLLDAGETPVKLAAPAGSTPSTQGNESPVMVALLAAVDMLAREGGELFALETARLSNSRVSLVDSQGRERASLDNVNISMVPVDSATRRIDVQASTQGGQKDFSIELKAADEQAREASVVVRRFPTSDIAELLLGDGWRGLDGLGLSGRISVATKAPGQPPLTRLDLDIAPGTIDMGGPKPTAIKIDSGKIAITHDAATGRAELSELRLKGGATDVALKGHLVRGQDGRWSAQLEGAGVAAGESPKENNVQLDKIGIRLSGGGEGALLRLDHMELVGPAVNVSGSGTLKGTVEAPAVDAKLTILPSNFRSTLALWPVFLSPEVRTILSQRVLAGQIERLDLGMDFPPDVLQAANAAQAVPDDSIKVTMKAGNVRFMIADGLPDLTEASVTAISTGRTLLVEASSAKAEVEPGRVLSLSEGAFVIADTYSRRAIGRTNFRTVGGADALASLLARPILREFAPGQIDPAILKGSIDLRTSIALPLADDVKPGEVQVVSNGTINNLASDGLIPGEKLEGATLRTSFERNTLTLKGEGRISGLGGTIDVRLDQKGAGEASFNAAVDQATRQRRGFTLPGVTGPIQLKATKALSRDKTDNPVRIEADLVRAGIEGLLPGWTKPAGRAGKVSFVLAGEAGGIELNDFTLESAPVLLKGRIELGAKNNLELASFTTAKISPGDDLRLDVKIDGNVSKVTIRGRVLDARPLMKQGGRDDKTDRNEPETDLDISVPIVTGYNNEVISNLVLKGQRRQGEMRTLTMEGRIGRAAINARIQRGQGAPQLVVEAEDGGALLRFHDLYRRAYGGELIVQTPVGEARGQGQLLYRDFTVRNEPALRRVLAEGQSTGGIGGDRAVNVPRASETSDVAFTKLRAEFSRTPNRIDFKDIVIWGPLLGFTAQGNVDLARDRVDLAGTFVPSYAFNNAFSQVPIFGRILGGGQYEGLFAVNFRLNGPFSQPVMSINPLSAIAPGILRRFVDPGGGGSNLFDR
ncbi:MAG: AsmA-like C-terminal region-containing protein [Bosea sp. (in: a-proteobacteria)]